MHILLMLLATLAFLGVLVTAVLSGFDIVPWSLGGGITFAWFLLGILAVSLIFYRFENANGD